MDYSFVEKDVEMRVTTGFHHHGHSSFFLKSLPLHTNMRTLSTVTNPLKFTEPRNTEFTWLFAVQASNIVPARLSSAAILVQHQ